MNKNNKPLYVTQPFMPLLEEFLPYLEEIWDNKILTNNGPLHRQLEKALCEHLGVEYLVLFSSGTTALLTALKALNITGEVITTPYTFAATAHVLRWLGLDPVFVDIEPSTLNLDPNKVEAAITTRTTAILPVHCYGNPCNTSALREIANRHTLKLLYDGAQAFGVQQDDISILRHGDLCALSFHATKVFSTFEGGAIVCHNRTMYEHLNRLKNFGFVNELSISGIGINGKLNEISSAFGLAQLKHIDHTQKRRAEISQTYRSRLQEIKGIRCLNFKAAVHNYGFFPVLIEGAFPVSRDSLYNQLQEENIFARRYFYPLLSNIPEYALLPSANPANLTVANEVANSVICLPIYPAMTTDEQERVLSVIKRAVSK